MVALGLTSIEFLFLLPIVVLIYYLIPRKIRQYYLLIVNLVFYASFGLQFVPVLIGEGLLIWLASLVISKAGDCRQTVITVCSVVIILLTSLMLTFRIGGRISESVVAPLGLSFFTLQAISYIVDISTGKTECEKNPIKLLIFLSFFPTVTSGPFFRFDTFIKQHNDNIAHLKPEYDRIVNGIVYMIYGYFLKLVIAERAAIPVNSVFDSFDDTEYGGIFLFVIAVTYSVQIYADFAGYSAIVIGMAQILGYDIPENFRAPYLSESIKEFWARWHISLSTWLRDYIYIPLGGNRKGSTRKHINVMITFVVSALWHGLSGHFLIWGLLHGIYQVIGDLTKTFRKRMLPILGITEDSFFHKLLKKTGTFILVTVAWVFFRTSVRNAVGFIWRMISSLQIDDMIGGALWEQGLSPFGWLLLWVSCLIAIGVDMVMYKKKMRIDEVLNTQGRLARCIAIIIISLTILILGIYGDQHDAGYFVYRGF